MYPRILIDNHTSNFGPTLLHCYTGILAGLLILDMFKAVAGEGGGGATGACAPSFKKKPKLFPL